MPYSPLWRLTARSVQWIRISVLFYKGVGYQLGTNASIDLPPIRNWDRRQLQIIRVTWPPSKINVIVTMLEPRTIKKTLLLLPSS